VSVKPEFIRSEVKKALANPAEQGKVRRLYLGQKVQAALSYFSVDDWKACAEIPSDADLLGKPCWLGLDLSSSIDVTAAVLLWKLSEDEWAVRSYFWLPEDNLEERGQRDRLPYARWSQERLAGQPKPILRLTEGNTIDFRHVRRDVAELAKAWKVVQVCADPWQMREFGPALQDEDKVPVVLVPQNFAMLSQPMKILQGKILQRRIRHDRNPLMTVMVGNVVPREDEKRNVLPSKKRSRGRIDGVQALLNVVAQLPVAKPVTPQLFFLGGR
jgi:phage terminase large subunit-like protein